MYIDKKHFYLATGYSTFEYPPKFYVDFFITKANLRRDWRSNSYFHFEIGIMGKYLSIDIKWGFVERERTRHEEEIYQGTKKLLEFFK